MHYANGREAKNGDKVVFLGFSNGYFSVTVIVSGNCVIQNPYGWSSVCPDLKSCLHVDDVLALFPAQEGVLASSHPDFFKRIPLVPDGSKKGSV